MFIKSNIGSLILAETESDGMSIAKRSPPNPSRRTGTSSGGFTASRNGDGGNRLAAGFLLPPFCVSVKTVNTFAGNRFFIQYLSNPLPPKTPATLVLSVVSLNAGATASQEHSRQIVNPIAVDWLPLVSRGFSPVIDRAEDDAVAILLVGDPADLLGAGQDFLVNDLELCIDKIQSRLVELSITPAPCCQCKLPDAACRS